MEHRLEGDTVVEHNTSAMTVVVTYDPCMVRKCDVRKLIRSVAEWCPLERRTKSFKPPKKVTAFRYIWVLIDETPTRFDIEVTSQEQIHPNQLERLVDKIVLKLRKHIRKLA